MEIDIAQHRRLRTELARTEKLPPPELAAYGRERLARLCQLAWQGVPYYRKRLAPLFSGGSFDFARWADVPILDRRAAREKYRELLMRPLPSFAGATEESWTSGSTGTPMRFLKAESDALVNSALSERAYDWWGFDSGKTVGQIKSFSEGETEDLIEQGSSPWRDGAPEGRIFICPITWPPARQLDWVRRKKIDYLFARMPIGEVLAEEALRSGIKLRLEAVMNTGTILHPAAREKIRLAFGCPVRDAYGATEVGHLGTECPQCGTIHLDADAKFIEILRDDGAPAGPGQIGRVHVTSFYSYAMPLIRYDLEDYAEVAAAPNICGRGLPSLARIIGREIQAFRRRDGSRFFPFLEAREFRRFMSLQQAQFVQTDYDRLEIRYVPMPGDERLDRAAVERHARSQIGEEFQIQLTRVEAIARDPAGKALATICAIKV